MSGISQRVFVIGIDGAIGSSVRRASTPRIDDLLAGGVVTYGGRSVFPSASYQAWGSMFHGEGDELTGGPHAASNSRSLWS